MKSKKSYFNLTVFKKNIASSWPVWASYLAILIVYLPLMSGLQFASMSQYMKDAQLASNRLELLQSLLSPELVIVLNALWSLFAVIVVFKYLYSSKMANMIHSLPVTRMELYVTNIISCMVMLIGAQIIAFVLEVFVCIAFEVTAMTALLEWLFYMGGTVVLFLSMAVFCTFLSGNTFATAFYYVLINFIYEGFRYVFGMFIGFFAYGIGMTDFAYGSRDVFEVLSPLFYLENHLFAWQIYTEQTNDPSGIEIITTGVSMTGGVYILRYLVVAVVLFILGGVMYQKRKLELAGDMVSIPFVRPVMRWLLGIGAGAAIAIVGYVFLASGGISIGLFGVIVVYILAGVVAFMAAQMLIRKTFRIFTKRFLLETMAFCCGLIIVFGGVKVYADVEEKYIPDPSDVVCVTVDYDYTVVYENNQFDFVQELQEYLITHKDELYDYGQNDVAEYGNCISITYQLKDQKYLRRTYYLKDGDDKDYVVGLLREQEQKEENAMNYLLGSAILSEDDLVKVQFSDYVLPQGEEQIYDSTGDDFNKAMYEAVVQDLKEGNLLKYNYYFDENSNDVSYYQTVILNYVSTQKRYEKYSENHVGWSGIDRFDYWTEESKDGIAEHTKLYIENRISFGKDSKHIIQCLIDYGYIDSVDDLIDSYEYDYSGEIQ